MSRIIVFMGYTGSGKDTAADYLVKEYNCVKVHPIDDLKRFLESHFNYPKGYLDTRDGKAAKVLDTEVTNQQMMVENWLMYSRICPEFSRPYLEKRLDELIAERRNVVVVGVRNKHEVELLQNFKASGCQVDFYWVQRQQSVVEVSDMGQSAIFPLDGDTIKNYWGLEELYKYIDYYVA